MKTKALLIILIVLTVSHIVYFVVKEQKKIKEEKEQLFGMTKNEFTKNVYRQLEQLQVDRWVTWINSQEDYLAAIAEQNEVSEPTEQMIREHALYQVYENPDVTNRLWNGFNDDSWRWWWVTLILEKLGFEGTYEDMEKYIKNNKVLKDTLTNINLTQKP